MSCPSEKVEQQGTRIQDVLFDVLLFQEIGLWLYSRMIKLYNI